MRYVFVSPAHSAGVTSLSWHPWGRFLASGSHDSTVRVWDVESGREVRRFGGYLDWVGDVAWSPSGEFLAAAYPTYGREGFVVVWRVDVAEEVAVFDDFPGPPMCVVWSRDGGRLFVGDSRGFVSVLDFGSGDVVGRFKVGSDFVHNMVLSPDGRYLACLAPGPPVIVWDLVSWRSVRRFNGDECVAWSPDGRYLAARDPDSVSDLVVWDFESGDVVRRVKGGDYEVISVAWSPDGKYLAVGRRDNVVDVLRTDDWSRVFSLRSSFTGAFLVWSPDGRYIAGSPHGEYVCVWSATDGVRRKSWSFDMFEINALALSSDDRFVAVSLRSEDLYTGVFVVRDASNGSEVWRWGSEYLVSDVAWSPDGRYFVFVNEHAYVIMFDILGKRRVWVYQDEELVFNRVAWSRDNRYIVGLGDDDFLCVWDAFTGKPLRFFEFDYVSMGYSPFSPDSRFIVLSLKKGVSVFDAWSGEQVMDLESAPGEMSYVSWSPCGRFIAGVKGDVIYVWDAISGDLLTTFDASRDWVIGLVWLSDSRYIVSAGENGFVRVWDIDSSSEATVFRVRHALSALSVSRNDVLAIGCKSCDIILLYPRDKL